MPLPVSRAVVVAVGVALLNSGCHARPLAGVAENTRQRRAAGCRFWDVACQIRKMQEKARLDYDLRSPKGWSSRFYQFPQGGATPSRENLLARTPTATRIDSTLEFGNTGGAWAGLGFSDHFASYHVTHFFAPNTGDYTFWTSSDDGSMLHIDGVLRVNNDGLHGMMTRSGTVTLTGGQTYTIEVTFFEHGGHAGLDVQYEGPGASKRHLAGMQPANLPLNQLRGGFFSEESHMKSNVIVDYPKMHAGAGQYSKHRLHPLVGLKCRGKYCDDLQATYNTAVGARGWQKYGGGGITLNNNHETHIFGSDETKGGPKLCTGGRAATQLICHGSRCDRLEMVCSMTKGTASWSAADFKVDSSDTHVTPWFSEEGGATATCDPSYVLIGIQCHGKRCDDKRLTCARATKCTQGYGKAGECAY